MKNNELMWSVLVHLGMNMWNEEGNTEGREDNMEAVASSVLRFDRPLYERYIEYLREKGANTIIIDVAEGMRYDTHPELAVEGSLSREEMTKEVTRLKEMGFEVVPKLNFSATHDLWLKDYAHMLSTPIYRQVCADLIKETCEVFRPKYFHLGMDEETWALQRHYLYVTVRQRDYWWKDFYHLVDCVENENARPWIWSDYMWNHPDFFLEKMPKSVIQSNWYYRMNFNDMTEANKEKVRLESFDILEKHGYDQVPTGSNFRYSENLENLVEYCRERIAPEHLMGFMQTPWLPFIDNERCRHALFDAADTLKDAKDVWENKKKASITISNITGEESEFI